MRAWFLLTSAAVLLALIWSFAPILIPVLLVGGGLGVIVVAVVSGARWLERRWGRDGDELP